MKLKNIISAFSALLLIALIPNIGLSQPSLIQCRIITDSLERLRCYDNLVDGQALNPQIENTNSIIESPIVSISNREIALPPVEDEVEIAVTDSTEPQFEQFGLPRTQETSADKQELISIVDQIKKTGPNRLRITLNNGQVWSQTTAKRFSIKVGESVRINESPWGSDYRLSVIDKFGYIQVRRSQ